MTTRRSRCSASTVAIPAGPASARTASASRCWTVSERVRSRFIAARSRPSRTSFSYRRAWSMAIAAWPAKAASRSAPSAGNPCWSAAGVHVDRPDRRALDDERRAEDGPEVVVVQRRRPDARTSRSRSTWIVRRPRIACDDRPSPNASSKPSISGGKFATATTRSMSRSRSQSNMSPLSAPSSAVASVDDRGQDRVEVQRLGDASGRREEPVEPVALGSVGRWVRRHRSHHSDGPQHPVPASVVHRHTAALESAGSVRRPEVSQQERPLSTSTDVLIIGGGIVGAATAYHLSRRGADVILLESDRLASGATGRNLGYIWLHTRRRGPGAGPRDGDPRRARGPARGTRCGLRPADPGRPDLLQDRGPGRGHARVRRGAHRRRRPDAAPRRRRGARDRPDPAGHGARCVVLPAGCPDRSAPVRAGLRRRGPAPRRPGRRGRLGPGVRDGRWPDHAGR